MVQRFDAELSIRNTRVRLPSAPPLRRAGGIGRHPGPRTRRRCRTGLRVRLPRSTPHARSWRNRQTHQVEGLAPATRHCGFDSRAPHHTRRAGGMGRRSRLKSGRRKAPAGSIPAPGTTRAGSATGPAQRTFTPTVVGSSPTQPTRFVQVAQPVEHPPVKRERAGSIPALDATRGLVAQLAEQRTLTPQVAGSIPSRPTISLPSSSGRGHLILNQRIAGPNPAGSTNAQRDRQAAKAPSSELGDRRFESYSRCQLTAYTTSGWRSGDAAGCKPAQAGSTPAPDSILPR